MGNILPGYKTYILAGLGIVSSICLYIMNIMQVGFNLPDFLKFLQSDVIIAALATLRLAIPKKV